MLMWGGGGDKETQENSVFKSIFNIIHMYTLGFRNITIHDKTSHGGNGKFALPNPARHQIDYYNIHSMIQSTFQSEHNIKINVQ